MIGGSTRYHPRTLSSRRPTMNPLRSRAWFLSVLGTLLLAASAPAAVKLPGVLSSHAVLQRDRAAPIWGTADPGEKVTVEFRDQTRSTEADKAGKWLVKLDPLKAGGPD